MLTLDAGEKIRKSLSILYGVVPSLLFFFSSLAFAARPLTTDDAWTVEKGELQFETGLDVSRQDNHDREVSPSLTISYGLLERMDVGIGSAYLFARPKEEENENGLGDTEVKLKYRLFDEKDCLPAFAIGGKLKIPTASESKGLGSGKADFGIDTMVTKKLRKKWVFHLNLGYTFVGEHGADNELNYSAAAQFILSDRWALVGEMVGVNNLNGRKRDDPISGLLGAYCLISDDVIWDAGIEIGMNRAAPDFRFTTGLTLLFKP
ncbi:MAG: transporter [Syntrophaceae bacterium]|nr:transporter [Syntrophaceae bacterium]